MQNSDKILKTISKLIENSVLSSKDIKDQISTDFKFKRDKLINKLELVSRQEFEVLKKIVQPNQEKNDIEYVENKCTKIEIEEYLN